MSDALDTFPVTFDVTIRFCRKDDLPALEWLGLFAPHRQLIHDMFEQHCGGTAIMLVIEANGHTSGQLWIDLQRAGAGGAPEIWAVRILPCLHRLGIGTRMMRIAEQLLWDRGFRSAQVAVEIHNVNARRLYERLGYTLIGSREMAHPPGESDWIDTAGSTTTQWVLRKDLLPPETEHEQSKDSAWHSLDCR
jgi:GNAT superfamily N-acetyltransferase